MRYLITILLFTFFALIGQAQDKPFLNAYDKYWEIDDGFYRVMEDGKIGLVNQNGDIIIPCENDQVWNLQDNGNIKVLKNGKLGIYNTNGDIIVPTIYEMIWGFEDGKARVLRNGKIGYVNQHGNEFIPCEYDQIRTFEDGKAKVLKNGRTGFVNLSGHEFIPAIYHKIWEFEDGIAKVLRNGKMGYINLQGLEIIPCEYQSIGTFIDGVAQAVQNGQISYIDKNGNPTSKLKEDTIVENDARVVYADQKVTGKDSSKTKVVDRDTTVIKFFGSKVEIVDEDGTKEFSFDKDKSFEQNRNDHKKHRKFRAHYWGVDIGLNNYMSRDGNFSLPDGYNYLSLNTGKSIEVSVNAFQQNISLSRRGNVGFVTGLGLTYNNYRFDNPNIPVSLANGNLSSVAISDPIEKNKLTTLYLTAPVLFELQFSRKRPDAFYISTGVIGGYRLKSHTKVVSKIDGDRTKDKNNDSFALNDFRYGAQLRVGFKAINLYATYYLSEMFENDKGPELYPISFGISLYPGSW
ncbi:WG repeat-containing protein [Saccharicrinis sp. GN24d3]|uniref:WG repeat-containing protein n=1 Tax=Saccharicrinis sp. GN24d3 TaxID=3458416 RepID=UPI004035648D